MHVSGSMYSCVHSENFSPFFVGWMQSTGQTSTHEASLVPMHGSAMMCGMAVWDNSENSVNEAQKAPKAGTVPAFGTNHPFTAT